MPMRTLALGALLLTAAPTALAAQDDGKQVVTTREDAVRLTGSGFDQADANKDGVLTRKEWDRKYDAQIAGFTDITPKEAAQLKAESRDFFRLIDADKDGRIARAELVGWYDKLFECQDENRDGVLTMGEMDRNDLRCSTALGVRETAELDSISAVPRDPPQGSTKRDTIVEAATQAFNQDDTDQDGFLTPAEWAAANSETPEGEKREGFARFDADRDGRISRQEALDLFLALFDCADADRDGVVKDGEGTQNAEKCMQLIGFPRSEKRI